ncbi:phage portal protein [Alkalihalophilus pseudofirmus]|uniref:Phage portal protein n=1 Tax=Alkalihalophilus pseudofirmus TaxID=79885 RepID=A0AAJ2KS87_ALKPS|nr:phage portal protein [Alkalihalophilus pseudofirmus]MDV2883826.1 phage portal protein [Alkalihalophilus pseudofirmus]
MYPSAPTETEIINDHVTAAKNDRAKFIKELITNHDTTKMREGVRYYDNDNDILLREQYAIHDGKKIVDEDKPNNRIPHAWHKLLVDQKVNYLLGQPVNFIADDKALTKHINYYLGETWDNTAIELATESSNKGVEWLHPYIDEDGEFQYMIIPAEQGIPIWKDDQKKELAAFIRFYPDGETVRAEFHDKEWIYYYRSYNGEWALDELEEENPAPHFKFYKGESAEGYGWGKVPFIEFANNSKRKGDLEYYKKLIDAWDNRVSDNQNNFDEIQELIYVLRDYEGQDLSEFMHNLKKYKAINVSGNGGVDTLQGEIPMTSIDIHLSNLKESLFTFGQGVDVGTEKFGQSPSGVALKFLYSLLDLKASALERRMRPSMQLLIWFLCQYLEMSKKGKYDYKSVDYVFQKTMITNDLENSQIAQNSKGIISDKTIVANHPWVKDAEQEELRLREQYGNNMTLDDDDDESS